MGIQGLLLLLKSIEEKKHIREYEGLKIAVDGYCWLHRATYSCSEELMRNQHSEKYITSFMNRVKLLTEFGIEPYIVFDGANLPAKAVTEKDRVATRELNRKQAIELLNRGDRATARRHCARAVDVTATMAYRVIQRLKEMKIKFIVAPYEADAQMSFLCQAGMVDAVISEDSDCIPYKCKKILFKMDSHGYVKEIDCSKLNRNVDIDLSAFTTDMFLDMCILSGCDYLASLHGIGLKTAHMLLKRTPNVKRVIERLTLEGKTRVPKDYEYNFRMARLTFLHQRVYNPETEKLQFLTPIPNDTHIEFSDLDFLGPEIDDGIAKQIADGLIDPTTQLSFLFKAPKAQVGENAFQYMIRCTTENVENHEEEKPLDLKENGESTAKKIKENSPAEGNSKRAKYFHEERKALTVVNEQKPSVKSKSAFDRYLLKGLKRAASITTPVENRFKKYAFNPN